MIYPKQALRLRPAFGPQLLSEILESRLLCVENEALSQLLTSWGNYKKRKANGDDNECQAIITKCLSELESRQPARYSVDVLGSLWELQSQNPNGYFLGYWVTLTLGSPSTEILNPRGSLFQDYLCSCARNEPECLRMSGSYVIWALPHFSVYLQDFCFRSHVPQTVHFQIFCSQDGARWHLAVASDKRRIEAGTPVECNAPDYTVKYFKLQLGQRLTLF